MKLQGNLLKMNTDLKDTVEYHLPLGDHLVNMNELIGKEIHFKYLGQINCVFCGKKTKTSFQQGSCYSCFQKLPQNDPGIMSPEKDLSHLGISRDMEWSKKNSLQDHFVYLALSSAVKVGVTRYSQVPTRWMDQGASKAICIAKTPNRHIAGVIEVELKKNFTDKTNWRNMLKNIIAQDVDLIEEKQKAASLLHPELAQYIIEEAEIVDINYPVDEYPTKLTSIGFDKIQEFSSKLMGIKGQYLLLEDNKVINMRKHAGYLVELNFD